MINIDHIKDIDDITKEDAIDIIKRKKQYKLTDRAVELINRIVYKYNIRVFDGDSGEVLYKDTIDFTEYKAINGTYYGLLNKFTKIILNVSNPNRTKLINKTYEEFCDVSELNSIFILFEKADKSLDNLKKKIYEQNEIEIFLKKDNITNTKKDTFDDSIEKDDNEIVVSFKKSNNTIHMSDESIEYLKEIIAEENYEFYGYRDRIAYIHHNTDKKQRKRLLNLLYLIPYINYYSNFVCDNTMGKENKDYCRLDLYEMCNICGYNKDDVKQLRRDLLKLNVNNESVFCIINDYVSVMVNAYVFWLYPIYDNDKDFIENQRERIGGWFHIGEDASNNK